MSLRGGPERPLCDAAKVKPELQWRPEDVRDAIVVGSLPRRAAYGKWRHLRRQTCIAGSRAGEADPLRPLKLKSQMPEL